jgi:hypothetical protein
MQKLFKRPIKLWGGIITALLAVFVLLPAFVLANQAPSTQNRHTSAAFGAGANPELWRLGFSSEGDASYTTVIGRLVSNVASFRSSRGVGDIYYIFPAAAHTVQVDSARMNILTRSGTYSGTAALALEVRDLAGVLQHSVSAAPLDLEGATVGSWVDFTLSPTATNLLIDPGQVLLLHASLSAGSRDDLDVRPMFEIYVK